MSRAKSQNTNIAKIDFSGFVIERTAKRMKRLFQQTLNKIDAGITADQWVVLQILDEEDGLSQFEIAQRTEKDAPTITRIIDLLQKKSMIERKPDSGDRRKFRINLTEEGKKKIKQLLPSVQQFRKMGYNGLNTKDVKDLNRILDIVYNNLS